MASYRVALRSTEGRNIGTTNYVEFFFDWAQLPESKYNVSFSFFSSNITIPNANTPILIYGDFGGNTVWGNNTIAQSFIGMVGTNNSFVTNPNYITSWPIVGAGMAEQTFLRCRPMQNLFRIALFNNTGQLSTLFNNATSWILTLHFTPIS
jgi:hypothetical protein